MSAWPGCALYAFIESLLKTVNFDVFSCLMLGRKSRKFGGIKTACPLAASVAGWPPAQQLLLRWFWDYHVVSKLTFFCYRWILVQSFAYFLLRRFNLNFHFTFLRKNWQKNGKMYSLQY